MKQRITIEQLKELPEEKLGHYMAIIGYKTNQVGVTFNDIEGMELASIGQMIEFLDKHIKDRSIHNFFYRTDGGAWELSDRFKNQKHYDDLCDLLWEAVKEIL